MGGENFKAQVSPPWWVCANPLSWTLATVDVAAWTFGIKGPVNMLSNMAKPSLNSFEVGTEGARRRASAKAALHTTPFPDCKSAVDLLERTYRVYGDQKALGTRKYLGEHIVEGQRFPLQMFGETEWMTYNEVGAMAKSFGRGLVSLGMQPQPVGCNLENHNGPSTIMIYEDTCKEWTMAAHGSLMQSIAVATSYSTLGIEALEHSLQETNCTVIFTNHKKVKDMGNIAKSCPKLKTIIYTNHRIVDGTPPPPPVPGVQVISFEDVIALGQKSSIPVTAPTPDQVAVVMYTSGSTGQPKGVMLTHKMVTAAVSGTFDHLLGDIVKGDDLYISYLPAAHILEFTAQMTFFCYGAQIGYACPKTISSKGACRKCPDGTVKTTPGYPYPPGAIQEFRPSMMPAVPKVWDILKKGVEDQISKGSPLIKLLFQTAFSSRAAALRQGRESPFFKKVVFKKVSAMMGGRLRNGLSGGGPIASDVQTFVRTVFGCNLMQGYGLTETCSIGTIQPSGDHRDGIVGIPLSCVEIKLGPCGEVMDKDGQPYKQNDTKHGDMPCLGRGEVLIRGAAVSTGYFRQPDKTAEAFERDGWFHTGDIGLWTADGSLMLVDRLKNLIKLKGGEYIALESMEKEFNTSPYVNALSGGVMVYGDGDMDRPVALIQGDVAKLKEFATKANITFADDDDLCANADIQKEVLRTMEVAHKNGKLGANEKLVAVHIISGTGSASTLTASSPWTPENGGLTASNKLQRKPICTALKTILDPLIRKGIR